MWSSDPGPQSCYLVNDSGPVCLTGSFWVETCGSTPNSEYWSNSAGWVFPFCPLHQEWGLPCVTHDMHIITDDWVHTRCNCDYKMMWPLASLHPCPNRCCCVKIQLHLASWMRSTWVQQGKIHLCVPNRVPLVFKPSMECKSTADPVIALCQVNRQGPQTEDGLFLLVFLKALMSPIPVALALERGLESSWQAVPESFLNLSSDGCRNIRNQIICLKLRGNQP